MAKIVFSMIPARGHVNGAIYLAKALRNRGHQVGFYGMADSAVWVESEEFAFQPMYGDWFPKGSMRRLNKPGTPLEMLRAWRKNLKKNKAFYRFLAMEDYRGFGRTMEALKPDLYIMDGLLPPVWALMAWRKGIPSAYLHTTLPVTAADNYPPFTSSLVPGKTRREQRRIATEWRKRWRSRAVFNRVMALFGGIDLISHTRRLARLLGYPREKLQWNTAFSTTLLDLPQLTLCPREFDFPEVTLSEKIIYGEAGVDLTREEPDFPWTQLDPRKKLVYCSMGTVFHDKKILQAVLDAVGRETSWQLVLVLAGNFKPDDFEHVREQAILVKWAPQLELLRHADVMITHAGLNSIKECILLKVPMVAFPLSADQPGNAARIVHHGLGLMGNAKHASSDQIYALIYRVLNEPSFKQRTAQMAARFKEAEKAELGATAIERILPLGPVTKAVRPVSIHQCIPRVNQGRTSRALR